MKETELRYLIREHIKRLLEAGPSLGAGGMDITRGLDKIEKRTSNLTSRQRVAAVLPVLQKFNIQPNDLSLLKIELSKSIKQSDSTEKSAAEKAAAEKAAAEKAAAEKAAAEKAAAEKAAAEKAAAEKAAAEKTDKSVKVESFISKQRAKADLKQFQSGKRSDGQGKYTAAVYGIDSSGKKHKITDENDLNKYKKFMLDDNSDLKENLSSLTNKGEKLDKTQAFQMLQRAVSQKPSTLQADFIVDLINKFNLSDSAKRRLKMIIKNMA